MTLDILGNVLYTGDVVVFADAEEGEPTLTVYEVEEIIDTNVVLATAMSGTMIGSSFYLQDTNKRCTFIRNVYRAAELKRKTTIH
jgi:hypothetical protein